MRATLLATSLFALLFVSACQSETGILISTSTAEMRGEAIESLRFFVGKNEIGDALYYADSEPLEDVELGGRDIAANPYRLLLSPGDNPTDQDEFVVAVLALGQGARPIGFGRLAAPVAFVSGKVLQWDIEIGALGDDVLVTDTGCLKFFDESIGDFVHIGVADDADCDGYTVTDGDCDDFDPNLSPGSRENCENGVDDNCNGLIDDLDTADLDNDGVASCGAGGERDCNDNNPDMFPGNTEVCDGLDNDCNGLCDDRFDKDEDLVTSCGSVLSDGQCVGELEPDCDDNDPLRRPGHAEACDGIDNDCNGICDDDTELDPDGDGYTDCGSVIGECGLEDFLIDCEPQDGDIHPGATELCDGIDNDCIDGDAESSPCFGTEAGDVCVEGRRQCNGGVLDPTCVTDLDGATILSDGICSAYATCDADASVPDPLACVLSLGNQQSADQVCQLALGDGEACAGDTVRIVPPGGMVNGALCSYAILGGQIQQGYQLTLVGENASGQAVSGCTADLRVRALGGAGDSTVNIFFDDGAGTASVIRLRLKTHRLAACGGLPGLSCSTWVAPATAQP